MRKTERENEIEKEKSFPSFSTKAQRSDSDRTILPFTHILFTGKKPILLVIYAMAIIICMTFLNRVKDIMLSSEDNVKRYAERG